MKLNLTYGQLEELNNLKEEHNKGKRETQDPKLKMRIYPPIKVSHKLYKKLVKEGGGLIFHRIDKDGQHWVKAANNYGKWLLESYGLDSDKIKYNQ